MSLGSFKMSDVPPWVVGVAIIAAVLAVSLLYLSEKQFVCSKTAESFRCGFGSEPVMKNETFTAYFYSWDKERKSYCTSETVVLGFGEDEISITARTTGKVKDRDGNPIDRSWTHRGFKHGNNLAIAYVTEGKPTTGNGVYYLALTQGDYAGFWIGTNWISGRTIRCPYVLTKSPKRGSESCEERWPAVFSNASQCYEVAFQ